MFLPLANLLLLLLLLQPSCIQAKAIATPLTELNYMPNPKEFWQDYVEGWKPVILRGAALDMPAMQWAGDSKESTESKLRRKFGQNMVRIERRYEERQKQYNLKNDLNPFNSVSINEFFDRVNQGSDGYVISVLPDDMTEDVFVPRCMLCGDRKYSHWSSPRRWMTAIEETGLWISTEGATYSQLHFDQPNIINCMISGPSKTWMFVNTKKHHEQCHLERHFEAYNNGNAESTWHPTTSNHSPHRLTEKILENVPRDIVVQHPGDCIFVPHAYLHQVQKEEAVAKDKVSVAVSIMWNHEEKYSDKACLLNYPVHENSPPIPLSLFDQHWWYSGKHLVPLGYPLPYNLKENIINQYVGHKYDTWKNNNNNNNEHDFMKNSQLSLKHFLSLFAGDENDYNVQSVPGHEIYECIVNLFVNADCDDNGYLDREEIQWIPRTELQHLGAALDFASTWPDPYVPQPRKLIVANSKKLEKLDGIQYTESKFETEWMCNNKATHVTYVAALAGHMQDLFSLPNKHPTDEIDVNEVEVTLEFIKKYLPPMDLKASWDEEKCAIAQIKYCGEPCDDECITQCSQTYLRELRTACIAVPVGKPLILRGMAKKMPAFTKWATDESLKKLYPNAVLDVEVGNKQETRTHKAEQMYLNDFLDVYENTSMYAVAALPMNMAADVVFPEWVEAGGYTSNLQSAIMWWSNGNTKSVIHNDDVHNLNCVFKGRKRFAFWSKLDKKRIEKAACGWIETDKLVHEEQFQQSVLGYGAYGGHMNVSKMDLINYPCWSQLDWYDATMEEGDCILIPSKWYHHVHSLPGKNIAINLWFGSFKDDLEYPSGKPNVKNVKNQKKDNTKDPLKPLSPADCMFSEWPEGFPDADKIKKPCDRSGKYRQARIQSYNKDKSERKKLNFVFKEDASYDQPFGRVEKDNWNAKYFTEPQEEIFFQQKAGQEPPSFHANDPFTSKLVKEALLKGFPVVVRGATTGMSMNNWTCQTIIDLTVKHRTDSQIDSMGEVPQRHYAQGMSSDNVDPYSRPDWMKMPQQVNDIIDGSGERSKTRIGPSVVPGYWSLKQETENTLTNYIRSKIDVPQFMKDWSNPTEKNQKNKKNKKNKENEILNNLRNDFMNTPEMWFGMKRAGAKPHQDSHCTSTISFQLSGQKRWRTGPAIEVRNFAGQHGSYDGYINSSQWKPHFEVVLNPGDAIIIPSSFIHETKNVDPNHDICSMSITHQFAMPTPVRYIREYLPRLLLSPSVVKCGLQQTEDAPTYPRQGQTSFYNFGSLGWKNFQYEYTKPSETKQVSEDLWTSFLLYDDDSSKTINFKEFRKWCKRNSVFFSFQNKHLVSMNDLFLYFDMNTNSMLSKKEITFNFMRWFLISKYSDINHNMMYALRVKRHAFKCSMCGRQESETDLCYGPIRQFEKRARIRYSNYVLHQRPSSIKTVRQQTNEDARHSGMSEPCQNLMNEYVDLLISGHVPGKTDFMNGENPTFINSVGLARYIDVDQEANGNGNEKYGHEEDEDEEYEVEDEENYDDLGKYEDEIEYEVDEIDPEEYDLADVFKLMDGGELPEHP